MPVGPAKEDPSYYVRLHLRLNWQPQLPDQPASGNLRSGFTSCSNLFCRPNRHPATSVLGQEVQSFLWRYLPRML